MPVRQAIRLSARHAKTHEPFWPAHTAAHPATEIWAYLNGHAYSVPFCRSLLSYRHCNGRRTHHCAARSVQSRTVFFDRPHGDAAVRYGSGQRMTGAESCTPVPPLIPLLPTVLFSAFLPVFRPLRPYADHCRRRFRISCYRSVCEFINEPILFSHVRSFSHTFAGARKMPRRQKSF